MNAYIFNPTCEMEVANGTHSYMPPAHLLKFSEDLSMIPFLYAKQDDVVLVKKIPPREHCELLQRAGFNLPRFQLLSDVTELSGEYAPCPWGWSPAVAHRLQHFGAKWNDELRSFFSRRFALQILTNLQCHNIPNILNSQLLPIYVTTLDDVKKQFLKWSKIVVKAPFSSSGRGVEMLHDCNMNTNVTNKIFRTIRVQGGVMVEPLLDVICNFAYEFKVEKGQVLFLGFSSFQTGENGQYIGQKIPFLLNDLPNEAIALLGRGVVDVCLSEIRKQLQESSLTQIYEGYLGVDTFVFRDAVGQVLLQPCVEVNLRTTMGIVALHLEKHLAEGSRGMFRIINQDARSLHFQNKKQMEKYPLYIENDKIVSGYLPLTPLDGNTQSVFSLFSRKFQ